MNDTRTAGHDYSGHVDGDVYTDSVTIIRNGKMARQKQTDIKAFICYAREDMAIAKKLYKDLQQAGVKPWLDIEDLQPGQKWEVVIADVLKQSDFVVVLLSSYSLNKTGYFRKDLNNALKLMDMVPPDKSFLIPVRLEECEPKEEELQQIQ